MRITASLCYTADWHNTENQLCFNFKNLEQKFSFSVILFSVHISSAQQSQAVRGDHAGQTPLKPFRHCRNLQTGVAQISTTRLRAVWFYWRLHTEEPVQQKQSRTHLFAKEPGKRFPQKVLSRNFLEKHDAYCLATFGIQKKKAFTFLRSHIIKWEETLWLN